MMFFFFFYKFNLMAAFMLYEAYTIELSIASFAFFIKGQGVVVVNWEPGR